MSFLQAEVTKIQNYESLNIVTFQCHGQNLSMMSLDLDNRIKIGTQVRLIIKPTHIAIGKSFSGEISYSNQLPCTITSSDYGELLCSLNLDFFSTNLESIITCNSAKKMDLKEGDKVTAFIKASELSIGEVIND